MPFDFSYSGEIDKETAFSRSTLHGESAGDREGRVGVYLLVARRECQRLEIYPRGHHEGQFYQYHCL